MKPSVYNWGSASLAGCPLRSLHWASSNLLLSSSSLIRSCSIAIKSDYNSELNSPGEVRTCMLLSKVFIHPLFPVGAVAVDFFLTFTVARPPFAGSCATPLAISDAGIRSVIVNRERMAAYQGKRGFQEAGRLRLSKLLLWTLSKNLSCLLMPISQSKTLSIPETLLTQPISLVNSYHLLPALLGTSGLAPF